LEHFVGRGQTLAKAEYIKSILSQLIYIIKHQTSLENIISIRKLLVPDGNRS